MLRIISQIVYFGKRRNYTNDVPEWQKRSVGVCWESYEKPGVNPRTGEQTVAVRRRLNVDLTLPRGDAYGAFIKALLVTSPTGSK
jgi:hypothetical protein